eukprot:1235227-Ditylum_brightwellii.AAC.1
MEFTQDSKILDYLNVFISGTGAFTSSTNPKLGFKNIQKVESSDNIIDASGNSFEGSIVGYISDTM